MEYVTIPTTVWWLDTVKEALDCKNDAKLAEYLLTTRAAISMQRKGESNMQVKSAVRCGDLLQINPLLVVCSVMYHTAHREEDKLFWGSTFHRAESSPDNRHRHTIKLPTEKLEKAREAKNR